MPASARVLSRFRSRSHNMNAMAKEPAGVVNSFFEFVTAAIWVAGKLEKQRVSTSFADVLIMGCASGNRDVVMPAEKTGQRMSNAGNGVALIKNCGTAAIATRASVFGDSRVVDFMAKERAGS